MANVFKGDVWVIDTAAATVISTDELYFQAIRWVSTGAAAGHRVVLEDADGNVVWETYSTGANYVEESQVPLHMHGLVVPTLASGVLYLYHLLKP